MILMMSAAATIVMVVVVVVAQVCILRESPCGRLSALVRFGGKVYWWVD
jgi:hypothetical protein